MEDRRRRGRLDIHNGSEFRRIGAVAENKQSTDGMVERVMAVMATA